MRVAIVVGTRPEIIKMAPVVRAARAASDVTPLLWHTGQHYSYELDQQMFDDLDLPEPDSKLHVGSGSHGEQTGKIMAQLETLMIDAQPDVVLVQGDTNTVLGASLAATKLHIPLGHIEAGLRSYDRSMPEEINRIACDHIADVLYPPTEAARSILVHEGIPSERIIVTGNTAVDAALQSVTLAKQRGSITPNLHTRPYIFFTMHRAENVDDIHRLTHVVDALEQILLAHDDIDLIWAVHPRTEKQLTEFNMDDRLARFPHLRRIPPLGYLDTLTLESEALLVMTDSGGIQEEACVLGTPCLTLRENTERPESVEVGANELVGTSMKRIIRAANNRLDHPAHASWRNPFGDGFAGKRIIADIATRFA